MGYFSPMGNAKWQSTISCTLSSTLSVEVLDQVFLLSHALAHNPLFSLCSRAGQLITVAVVIGENYSCQTPLPK